MRLYYDIKDNDKTMDDLCHLACSEPNLDLCNVRKLPILSDISEIFPMIWRFLPMLDLQVDVMMSRDLDSVINERESAAVTQWMESSYAFHIMRDHPLHAKEIMGGLFGIKLGNHSPKSNIHEQMINAC